jgi:hypothetical protein
MFGLNRLAPVKKAFGNRPAKGAKQSQQRVCLRVEALERRDLMSISEPIAWPVGNFKGAWSDMNQPVQALSTVHDAQGNLHVFGIGTNNAVQYDWQSTNDGFWQGWRNLGGAVRAISTIVDAHGNAEVFAIGTNNAVYWGSAPYRNIFSGWTELGGFAQSITTSLDAHGNLDVFFVGGNNVLYCDSQSATSGAWSGWYSLGAWLKGGSGSGYLSASLDAQGNLDVFGIGSDSAVWCKSQSAATGSWSGYFTLGGAVLSLTTSRDILGNLDVFVIGTDGAVCYSSQPRNGGSFSSWTYMGRSPKQLAWQSVSAGMDSDGNLDVFTVDTSDNVYYQVAPPTGTLGAWFSPGRGVKSISIIRDNVTGKLDVFGVGSTNYGFTVNEAYSMMPTPYSYVRGGTLFGPNGPSYLDVCQGGLGDCAVMASLAEVAARAPAIIRSMFTYEIVTQPNGVEIGVYKVRFYDQNNQPQYVLVDPELPESGYLFDHPVNGVLWAALAEKAFAVATGAGFVNTAGHPGFNDYDVLNGSDAAAALRALTGRPAGDYNVSPSGIASAWNHGQFITIGTGTPTSPYIVGGHEYALVGYNPASATPFEIFNPWGTAANGWVGGNTGYKYGLWWVSASFLSQNFDQESVTSAAPGMVQAQRQSELPVTLVAGRQADPSEALFAALGGSANPSRPPDDGSAARLALSGANSAARLSPAEVASWLVPHKRASAADALFADANSFERP